MHWLDTKVTIPVIVSIITFLILHLFIEPIKAKKKHREDSLKNLYAPLYTIILCRLGVGGVMARINKNITGERQIVLGSVGNKGLTSFDYMLEHVLKNSGYASHALLLEINRYSEKYLAKEVTATDSENLMIVIVKEYNALKKKLKMEYSKPELKTGIPTYVEEVLNKS